MGLWKAEILIRKERIGGVYYFPPKCGNIGNRWKGVCFWIG
jgi:hypothetical protein